MAVANMRWYQHREKLILIFMLLFIWQENTRAEHSVSPQEKAITATYPGWKKVSVKWLGETNWPAEQIKAQQYFSDKFCFHIDDQKQLHTGGTGLTIYGTGCHTANPCTYPADQSLNEQSEYANVYNGYVYQGQHIWLDATYEQLIDWFETTYGINLETSKEPFLFSFEDIQNSFQNNIQPVGSGDSSTPSMLLPWPDSGTSQDAVVEPFVSETVLLVQPEPHSSQPVCVISVYLDDYYCDGVINRTSILFYRPEHINNQPVCRSDIYSRQFRRNLMGCRYLKVEPLGQEQGKAYLQYSFDELSENSFPGFIMVGSGWAVCSMKCSSDQRVWGKRAVSPGECYLWAEETGANTFSIDGRGSCVIGHYINYNAAYSGDGVGKNKAFSRVEPFLRKDWTLPIYRLCAFFRLPPDVATTTRKVHRDPSPVTEKSTYSPIDLNTITATSCSGATSNANTLFHLYLSVAIFAMRHF